MYEIISSKIRFLTMYLNLDNLISIIMFSYQLIKYYLAQKFFFLFNY